MKNITKELNEFKKNIKEVKDHMSDMNRRVGQLEENWDRIQMSDARPITLPLQPTTTKPLTTTDAKYRRRTRIFLP